MHILTSSRDKTHSMLNMVASLRHMMSTAWSKVAWPKAASMVYKAAWSKAAWPKVAWSKVAWPKVASMV